MISKGTTHIGWCIIY